MRKMKPSAEADPTRYARNFARRSVSRLLLKCKAGGADLHLVVVAEAGAGDGAGVDERAATAAEVLDFVAAGECVEGGVALRDLRIAEEVDLAGGGSADEGGVAVDNELFAGDEAAGDFEPAG